MKTIQQITQLNLAQMHNALGVENSKWGQRIVNILFNRPARQLANLLLVFDAEVGQHGLSKGVQPILQTYTREVIVKGAEHVPASGPIFIIANHPGLFDAVALFSSISRADQRMIAFQSPFLEVLPHVESHLIYLKNDYSNRYQTIRQSIKHLKQGGTLMTFPAGKIEPDPALFPLKAKETLNDWTVNIPMFAHLRVEPLFIPTLISGVIAESTLRNPLTKIRRQPKDQEWLAATLQLVLPIYTHIIVTVQFGQPIPSQVLRQEKSPSAMLALIQQEMAHLIDQIG